MSTERFIANRFNRDIRRGKSISRPITRIATYGIALGMAVILLSVSIVIGFQEEIRSKVIGFGAHIQITAYGDQFALESPPIPVKQDFYPALNEIDGVKNIQIYAIKPGILRPVLNDSNKNMNRDLQGVVVKGVGEDYDRSFFEGKMKSGKLFRVREGEVNDSIIVSKKIASLLQLELHQKVKIYFVKESGPKERNFIISGIYETGLSDFDRQFVFADIGHIRSVNNWGIIASIQVEEQCYENQLVLKASAFGGSGDYLFKWGDKPPGDTPRTLICPSVERTYRVVVYDNQARDSFGELMDGDTAAVTISGMSSCPCEQTDKWNSFQVNDSVREYRHEQGSFILTYRYGKGTASKYTGGFEVNLAGFNELIELDETIYNRIGPHLKTRTITEQYPEIFSWLNMLDMNVYIIIVLMVLVGLVNMTSALLVIILERTSTIGLLKSIGFTDWSIRKIFVFQGVYIIVRGLIIGNVLAIGIIAIQKFFHVFPLPAESYNLDEVPMSVEWIYFLLLNMGTLLVCSLALVLPSYLITRISPIKSLRFE